MTGHIIGIFLALACIAGVSGVHAQSAPAGLPRLSPERLFQQVSVTVVRVDAVTSDGKSSQGSGVAFMNGFKEVSDGKFQPASTWVVTNAHVVTGATRVSVRYKNLPVVAKVQALDDELDLALLFLDQTVLEVSKPSSSERLAVGETVYAIGSPAGLENTLSNGIVSGKRNKDGVTLVQTNAAISPGSSGGGLFDTRGQFVGVTTFRLRGGENLNFAVDASHIEALAEASLALEVLDTAYKHGLGRGSKQFSIVLEHPAFLKWMARAPSRAGGKRSSEVLDALMKGPPEADQYIESMVEAFLDSAYGRNLKEVKTVVPEENLKLICQLFDRAGAPLGELVATVDFNRKTVNGHSAKISDEVLEWVMPGDNPVTTRISRYSGRLHASNSKYPTMWLGKCEGAREKRF